MKFMLMMNGGVDSYDEYLGWPKDVREVLGSHQDL
jgi:hypothetical protein